MSDGGEHEPAVAAAKEYIMGEEGGNLPLDVDEDEDAELLPVLNSIWECPRKIIKCSGCDNNGKAFAGWTCGWCPLDKLPTKTLSVNECNQCARSCCEGPEI